ncbi:Periplasmic copper-binding protein (NosD) [uncultured archaeon]|nr:Periplasmic copper-binding protein (NosD) [uncultured archaeon]
MPVGGMASTDQKFTIKSADEPQKGELLYSDDFSDPGSGWKRSSTSESAYAYKNGRYHITVLIPQRSFYAYIPNAQTFKDFIVEVEAKAEAVPEDGSYGLVMRTYNGDFYRFEIEEVGKYAFYKYINEEWLTLVSFTASSAIETGPGINKIKIIAQGDTFTFYVNGEQLGECSDRSLSSGEIGLFASTRDGGGDEVSFDNLKVWEVGTAGVAEVASGSHLTVRPGESIQDAIDRAGEGSTIEVQSGTYRENVDVTKSLILRGVGNPVVEASDNHSAILLSADEVVLDGFTVTNAGVVGSVIGGIEAHSSGNIIRNNIANKDDHGILLWHSSDNIITGNTVTGNAERGIYLLNECNRNNISDNTVSSNDGDGIYIWNSTNNKVVGNTIHYNNNYGISISDSRNSALYRNKLVDNRNDAYDNLEDAQSGTNKWDDGSIGNYYSHLQCADSNRDGICDSPYSIPGGISVDRYPMASISENAPGVVVPTRAVTGGERISSSSTINSLQSGSANTSEGVRVDVPAGAVPPNEDGSPGKMVFSIEKDTTQIPSLPSDLKSFGSVYQLGPEGFIFDQPIEITLPIPEGVDPNQVMGITTFNDSSNQWELIPGTVDPQSRTVTIKTDHFSAYGIFGSSDSSDPDAWKRANGGWITIMNSHSRQAPPYYSECDPADTGRREHCKGLPTSISHGICILSATLTDPSLGYMIPRNLPWSIIASDWHERSLAPDVEKVWVPSGTYTIQEELGISEVNNDPLYLPCCQVKSNPAKAVRVAPGATVDFGDYSAFNEGPATVCGNCPMCPSAGRRARGVSTHETSVLTGDVQVTLTWHAEADIDLYVEDPNGDTVSYSNPSVPSGGELDRDNKCGDFEMGKPENIYWPEGGAPDGTYKVRVNYYGDCSDAGPVRWTVRVVVGSVAKTYTGTLESGGDTQDVTTFEKGAG